MRRVAVVVLVAAVACTRREPATSLELDRIKIAGEPRLRTDTVGEGRFQDTATFVLVDAENTASQGADVTLAGDLIGAGGAVIGTLTAQSLWIPAHESRTFALVDSVRKPRPGAVAVQIKVRGATVPKQPPIARIEDLHSFDDHGRVVVQGYLVNDGDRIGQIMVVGAFHDANGRPMTRPFQIVKLGRRSLGPQSGDCPDIAAPADPTAARCVVQFIGPEGSKRGTIFVGAMNY